MQLLVKYILLPFTLALFFCACVSENGDGNEEYGTGEKVEVSLLFKCALEQNSEGTTIPVTRAPSDIEESVYHNIWVFQFDGEGDDSFLIERPYYINEDKIGNAVNGKVSIPLINSYGNLHRLVFIANTNNKNFSWDMTPGKHTLTDLKNRYILLGSELQSYGYESKNIVMSGTIVTTISLGDEINGDGSGVLLNRSLAKIELELDVVAPGYEVLGVTLKNIPQKLILCDGLLEIANDSIYPSEVDVDLLGYVVDNTSVMAGSNRTYQWYMPRNMRGVVNEITSSKDKKKYAPFGATYIEVIAKDDIGNPVKYVIYPGANNVDDFNILPNRCYKLRINITGKDDGNIDSRVERLGEVTFEGNNNSFIINPPNGSVDLPRKFNVPVTRVNEYWSSGTIGKGGGQIPLLSNTKWKVELLWQDSADMVRSEGANSQEFIILTKSKGTGGDDVFSFEVPSRAKHGNFVIAIREDITGQPKILWSWHFWVTDYNPNTENVGILPHKWAYEVDNGSLYRLGGPFWGYNSINASILNWWNNYHYVGVPSKDAPLARSFMMDRSLGAKDTFDEKLLTYQWGRKDPFPSSGVKLYDINGNDINYNGEIANAIPIPSSDVEPSIVQYSVANPLNFLSGKAQWAEGEITSLGNYIWLDCDHKYSSASDNDFENKTGRFAKSIFDPCPQGWALPISLGPWNDLFKKATISNNERGLDYISYLRIYKYWPMYMIGGEYPVEGRINLKLSIVYRSFALGKEVLNTSKRMLTLLSSNHSSSMTGSVLQDSTSNFITTNFSTTESANIRCVSVY